MNDPRRRPVPTGVRIESTGPAKVTIEGETISRFSHQLRSLLTSVGAAAEYLLSNNPDQGVRDEMLGIISEQATRIDGLLDDFLVIANSPSSSRGAATAVNLYQVTRTVVRELAGEAQSVGAWLVLDTAGAVAPVIGYHQPLRQAVAGAIRAVLSLTRPGERVVARLEDARGDDGEKLVQFSITVQSNDPRLGERTDGLSATDLSLEAARRISELHGGTFELLDDRPGLACRLPAASMQIDPAAALRPGRGIEAAGC
ncbi:MAG: hypothetical protein R6V07_13285 [Armatimonadota bacterium]